MKILLIPQATSATRFEFRREMMLFSFIISHQTFKLVFQAFIQI